MSAVIDLARKCLDRLGEQGLTYEVLDSKDDGTITEVAIIDSTGHREFRNLVQLRPFTLPAFRAANTRTIYAKLLVGDRITSRTQREFESLSLDHIDSDGNMRIVIGRSTLRVSGRLRQVPASEQTSNGKA